MKSAVVCLLLLLSACSNLTTDPQYDAYRLTWRCLSPEGCERAEQVELIDRAEIDFGSDLIEFLSSRDEFFSELAQMVMSDLLPAGCSWLHGFSLSAEELEPSQLCRTPGGFELELSIPKRDGATHSEWFVEAREIDP
jgi:hypothetical protein